MKSKKSFSFIFGIIFPIFFFSFIIPNVVSHAPETIIISYSEPTDTLDVYLTHPVSNPATHYINQVEIYINNTLIDTYTYSSQPTDSGFNYQYDLVANNGDIILVLAYCSESGLNSDEITVGESGNEPNQPGSIPMDIFPIIIFSFIGIIILLWSKRKISQIK